MFNVGTVTVESVKLISKGFKTTLTKTVSLILLKFVTQNIENICSYLKVSVRITLGWDEQWCNNNQLFKVYVYEMYTTQVKSCTRRRIWKSIQLQCLLQTIQHNWKQSGKCMQQIKYTDRSERVNIWIQWDS